VAPVSAVDGMPIDRFLGDSNLHDEDVEVLNLAFEEFLQALGLFDRNDLVTKVVAKRIIAIGRTGLRDPVEICSLALKELRG
jgi:hypothetical protein